MTKPPEKERSSFPGYLVCWDSLIPAIMAGMSIWLWFHADGFTGGASRYESIGPGFFPKLILGLIIVVCLLQICRPMFVAHAVRPASPVRDFRWTRLLVAAIGTGAYAASVTRLGFLTSTLLFQLMLLALVFRVRDMRVLAGVPIAMTSFLVAVFAILMDVPLPRGMGLFADISRLFY